MRRANGVILAAICLVGLMRGGWWVAVTEVYSPIDEVAHVDYVASMATHGRPPEVGKDRVRNDLLEVEKASASSPWRSSPLTADNRDPKWGAFAQSYEGVQSPAYYALLAVPWKVLHGYGVLTMLYILRTLTVLLAIAAIPLTWLLAREMFPERVEVAVGASALLVVVGGYNANLASVTNDALAVPLSVGAMLVVARTWRRGFESRTAVLLGILVGLAVLSKTTALVLLPLVAIGALGPLWTRGTVARRYFVWGFQAAGVAAVVVAPWLMWNRATYHAFSAASEVDKITGPLQPPIPLTLHGLVSHMRGAGTGFWSAQLTLDRVGSTAVYWTAAGAIAILAGLVMSLRRRATRDALAIGWLALGVPLGFVTMVVIIAGVFGGSSSVVGRHLYPSLPALVIAIVGGCFVALPRRVGVAAVCLIAAIGLTYERADDVRYVRGAYTRGIVAGVVPVVGQSRGDEAVSGPITVHLEAPCAMDGVSLEFAEQEPAPVTIRSGGLVSTGQLPAGPTIRHDPGRGVFAFYGTASARSVDIEVPAGAAVAAGLPTTRATRLVPVASGYCAVKHPLDQRFDALFDPQHPNWPRAATLAWPAGWMLLGWLSFAAAVVSILVDAVRRRQPS